MDWVARLRGIMMTPEVLAKIQALEDDQLRVIYGMEEPSANSHKSCRHPEACAMCRKQCGQRINS